MSFIAKEMFLTRGVGHHKEKLASFEEALRSAKIAEYNLVTVSSIFPPGCKLIPREEGVKKLAPGAVVFVVMSRAETNENHRLVAASVGIAKPTDATAFGYLSEHHSHGQTEAEAGDYAEDLAASMLATTLGVEFNADANWNEKEEMFTISGKIVKPRSITQTAIGQKGGIWTTVIAAAVLVLE